MDKQEAKQLVESWVLSRKDKDSDRMIIAKMEVYLFHALSDNKLSIVNMIKEDLNE